MKSFPTFISSCHFRLSCAIVGENTHVERIAAPLEIEKRPGARVVIPTRTFFDGGNGSLPHRTAGTAGLRPQRPAHRPHSRRRGGASSRSFPRGPLPARGRVCLAHRSTRSD